MWNHDDVIKWKHYPRYWPFVRGIHRSPVNFTHKGQWRRALMFTLICVWINGCVNNREAGYLRRYCTHYGVTVMSWRLKSLTHRVFFQQLIEAKATKKGKHHSFALLDFWVGNPSVTGGFSSQMDINGWYFRIITSSYALSHRSGSLPLTPLLIRGETFKTMKSIW